LIDTLFEYYNTILGLSSAFARILLQGGPWATIPELLFEKKELIMAVQQLLISPIPHKDIKVWNHTCSEESTRTGVC